MTRHEEKVPGIFIVKYARHMPTFDSFIKRFLSYHIRYHCGLKFPCSIMLEEVFDPGSLLLAANRSTHAETLLEELVGNVG